MLGQNILLMMNYIQANQQTNKMLLGEYFVKRLVITVEGMNRNYE